MNRAKMFYIKTHFMQRQKKMA
jgi:hypothetical protein